MGRHIKLNMTLYVSKFVLLTPLSAEFHYRILHFNRVKKNMRSWKEIAWGGGKFVEIVWEIWHKQTKWQTEDRHNPPMSYVKPFNKNIL